MNPVWIVLGVIFATLTVRLAAGALDRGRIEAYLKKRGAKLTSIRWTPFGPGWFGEGSARLYEVRFVTGEGQPRITTCKTSAFSGVYFTNEREDVLVRRESQGNDEAELTPPADA